MSRTVMFLVFGVLNTKYLSFRIPDASILILYETFQMLDRRAHV